MTVDAAVTASRSGRSSEVRALAGLFVLFVGSRLLFLRAGGDYDTVLLGHGLQMLDVSELRDHTFQSVWYLHSQPPLFNLFAGLVLKVAGSHELAAFHASFTALGLVLTFCLYTMARRLGVGRRVAFVAVAVIVCGSTVLLYENWFMYEFPVMVGLTAAAAALLTWQRTGALWALAATTGLSAAVVLTRSLYHPLWLVAVTVIAVLARPRTGDRRPRLATVLVVSALPMLLVGGVLVKNVILFDVAGTNSWLGFNLSRVAFFEMSAEDRAALVAAGDLPPTAVLSGWLPVGAYESALGPCVPAHPDVPVLAEPAKAPTDQGEELNFNAECYLPVYDQFQRDAMVMIRKHPRPFTRSFLSAMTIWALPSSDYPFLRYNQLDIQTYDGIYRSVVLGGVPVPPPYQSATVRASFECPRGPNPLECGALDGQYHLSLTIVLGTLLALFMGVRGVWRWWRGKDHTQAVWVFIALTVGWTMVIGNLFEVRENNRFRAPVEPLTLLVLVVVACQVVAQFRARSRGADDS